MIVTVTPNAAIDKTLNVANFQLGQRHRCQRGESLAGGKGINVARALKRLETPVVATGLAGGRTGDRIVEDLGLEGILSDFVRISDESRTSIAVVDPTAGALTEVYEWGPAVRPEELHMLTDKLHYLSRVASFVVFSGSLPRDVDALAAGAGEAVRCPVPVTELEVRNRQRAVDRGIEGYGDDHCRCTTRGAGYWTRIVSPTRRACGSMPGLRCSSFATVVPVLAAIPPSVSPDWTV